MTRRNTKQLSVTVDILCLHSASVILRLRNRLSVQSRQFLKSAECWWRHFADISIHWLAHLGSLPFPLLSKFCPLPSDRQHLSYDVCLEVRGEQNCSVVCCVLKLHTVISTLRWAFLTVLWTGFCHTEPISLCIDLFGFVFVFCVFLFHTG